MRLRNLIYISKRVAKLALPIQVKWLGNTDHFFRFILANHLILKISPHMNKSMENQYEHISSDLKH